jgi:hypothetical protein
MRNLNALLTRAIDYAGIFPPASLSFAEALDRYRSYAAGKYAWMLGNFVVTAELAREVPDGIPFSAVGSWRVDRAAALEIRWDGLTELPVAEPGPDVYVEGPAERLASVKSAGLFAKIRTGGVDEELIPSVTALKDFIDRCIALDLPFKATAGLHHPVRGSYPLTYEAAAPRAAMHGFLNLFLYVTTGREELLWQTDPAALPLSASREQVRRARRLLRGFGSCSFEEPVEGLREMGWLQ